MSRITLRLTAESSRPILAIRERYTKRNPDDGVAHAITTISLPRLHRFYNSEQNMAFISRKLTQTCLQTRKLLLHIVHPFVYGHEKHWVKLSLSSPPVEALRQNLTEQLGDAITFQALPREQRPIPWPKVPLRENTFVNRAGIRGDIRLRTNLAIFDTKEKAETLARDVNEVGPSTLGPLIADGLLLVTPEETKFFPFLGAGSVELIRFFTIYTL